MAIRSPHAVVERIREWVRREYPIEYDPLFQEAEWMLDRLNDELDAIEREIK